jgi:hypothetical protein
MTDEQASDSQFTAEQILNYFFSTWERRKDEILQLLALVDNDLPTGTDRAELYAEFKRLEITIQKMQQNPAFSQMAQEFAGLMNSCGSWKIDPFKKYPYSNSSAVTAAKTIADIIKHRVPLSVQKQKLIDFLAQRGAATRASICSETGIPSGSLSELLKGPEFVSLSRGVWGLRGRVPPSTNSHTQESENSKSEMPT